MIHNALNERKRREPMASGDAQRAWFPEMLDELKARWLRDEA